MVADRLADPSRDWIIFPEHPRSASGPLGPHPWMTAARVAETKVAALRPPHRLHGRCQDRTRSCPTREGTPARDTPATPTCPGET